TNRRFEDESEKEALVGGLEPLRGANTTAHHEVRVAFDEDLHAADDFVRHLDAGITASRRLLGQVRLGDEVERFGDAVRDRCAGGIEFGVFELGPALELIEARVFLGVAAEADVRANLQLPERTETLLDHELWPIEELVGAEVELRALRRTDARL